MQDRIHGSTLPVLEVTLDPGETVIAETGELSWMTSSIQMKTSLRYAGGCNPARLLTRSFGGGSLFMSSYTAQSTPGLVAFATRLPGTIFPVDISSEAGHHFRGHRHAFLCGTLGVRLSVSRPTRIGAGAFGGNGFLLQSITGSGRCWIELSGEIVTYDLHAGEELRVHPGHVGLFQDSVDYSLTTVRGLGNKLFGGDGIFLARLRGPGRVWLQSLTLQRLGTSLGIKSR